MMNDHRFQRVLGAKDTLALAFGAMIGWGWVVLTGDWIETAGSMGAALAFIGGGVMVILIGLTYAELASAMPQVGGEHVYSHRALGSGASFLCTWAIILGYVSVVAFEAVALPTVLEHLFPDYKVGLLWNVADEDVYLSWVLVGSCGAALMTWLNVRGIRASALLQRTITAFILLAGLLLAAGAFSNGSAENASPFFVDSPKGLLMVLIMTPFMFVGFDVIPQAAEEIDLPFKQIGTLLIIAVVMAVAWYVLMILAVSLALPPEQISSSSLSTADAMSAVFNTSTAGKALVFVGIGGIITSWNAFLVGGSRAVYALARARMLPAFLARLHPTYGTPVNAILMIGSLSFIAPLFGRNALVWLVNAGGLGIVTAYAMVAISFLVLRRKEPDMERPFRVTSGKLVGYTALALSLGIAFLYMPGSPSALTWPYEWSIVLMWSFLGVVLYRVSAARRLDSLSFYAGKYPQDNDTTDNQCDTDNGR
jgi:basic amino acid/polyamine antiporter, APA family